MAHRRRAALDVVPQPPRYPILGYDCRSVAQRPAPLKAVLTASRPGALKHLPGRHMYLITRDRAAGLRDLIHDVAPSNIMLATSWASMVPTVLLVHPEAVKAVLTSDYTIVPKNLLTKVFFAPWLGEGLLTGGGPKWKRTRRLLTPVRLPLHRVRPAETRVPHPPSTHAMRLMPR